jgi:arylformamidase
MRAMANRPNLATHSGLPDLRVSQTMRPFRAGGFAMLGRRALLALGIVLSLPLAAAEAQFGQRFRQRMGAGQDAPTGGQDIAYGGDRLQHLTFWPATGGKGPAPLVIFVHGGGWSRGDMGNATGAAKVEHFRALGYAVASVNYRLVPAAKVEDQASDVAHAVAALIEQASKLGFDPHKMVLMGHSAGAHLAALVGTDESYFAAVGLKPDAVAGVVLLDGAGYDVAQQFAQAGPMLRNTYQTAFGSDPARQRALSSTLHAALPNAPRFLILHIDRDDGAAQSAALGAALNKAGTPAEVKDVGGKGLPGHMAINRDLGRPGYAGTAPVDAFLKQVFGR